MSIIEDAVKSFALAHLLPLMGVLFSVGVLAYGGVKLAERAAYHTGYRDGGADVRDSAAKATIARLSAQHARDTLRADSLVTLAKQRDSLISVAARTLNNAPRYQPTIDPLPDSLTDVQRLGKMRVIVAATNDTINDVPVRAARYWFVSDSVAYAEHLLLGKFVVANRGWRDAWTAEHEAREGADSLAAAYATRLRAVELVPHSSVSTVRQISGIVLALGAGYFLAKHVR